MKIHNGPLLGRGDSPLSIQTTEGESEPMTVAGIIETACYYKANMDAQAEITDLASMRTLNKILDAVEKPGCCIEVDDKQFESVKPAIESIVVRSWPIHAPKVVDQLENYECNSDSCDNCDCNN